MSLSDQGRFALRAQIRIQFWLTKKPRLRRGAAETVFAI